MPVEGREVRVWISYKLYFLAKLTYDLQSFSEYKYQVDTINRYRNFS